MLTAYTLSAASATRRLKMRSLSRVQGLGFGFRVSGLGFRVSGLGFRV